mgnify:CR=1 FL=1
MLNPFEPISLDMVILIKVLKHFVIKPPINKIKVDLKNLFIILKFMKKMVSL